MDTTRDLLMTERVGITIRADEITIGERFTVRFMRTLRIPDDGGEYPLPPGLGTFPIRRVADYRERVPESWREHGGVFLPMYQREAMWLSFAGAHWKPTAVKVAVGKVNALSGKPWHERLGAGREGAQDYMVVPDQPWLDGINAGHGLIRQFVAMPLGMGYTVESQVTGDERFGGLQIISFEPKPGRFPDVPPPPPVRLSRVDGEMYGAFAAAGPVPSCPSAAAAPQLAHRAATRSAGTEMGLAAGGRMRQQIYPDRHGTETWDEHRFGRVYVHIVNSQMWREITGEPPPETPVSARSYGESHLPWFDLYDEDKGDIAPADALKRVRSVTELDADKGFAAQQDDGTVPAEPVITYGTPRQDAVADGSW
jgi:hypothetical protein